MKELRFAAVGQVRVLGDEGELTLEKLGSAVHGASLYRAEVKTPTDEPREIQIVIQPRPGCFEASLTEPVDMACGVGPVSYTHLDVYKRQCVYWTERHLRKLFGICGHGGAGRIP